MKNSLFCRLGLVAALLGVTFFACDGTLQEGGGCNEGEIVGEAICEDGRWVDYEGPCLDVECSDNGACVEVDGDASCDCDDGFEADGLSCVAENGDNNQPGDPCDDINCGPNGSCVDDGDGNPACDCDADYEADGLSCVLADPCTEYECEPNGNCELDGDGNPECDCNDGYEPQGDTCAPEDTPCDVFSCEPNGSCEVDANGNAECDCDAGYEPSGTTCVAEPTDPCDGVNCSPGTCEDVGGSAQCNCPAGYQPTTSGDGCELEPDPCDGVNCGPNGSCVDQGGSAVCDCDSGYEADGQDCVRICHGAGNCAVHVLDGPSETAYEVTDYDDTELADQIDAPIVASFALEGTDRGYLLTESSYYQIDTTDFSVTGFGSLGSLHSEFDTEAHLAGAYAVGEGSGSHDLILIARDGSGDDHFRAIVVQYDYPSGAVSDHDETAAEWSGGSWGLETSDENAIQSDTANRPEAGGEILAIWWDPDNEGGFADGDVSEYCEGGTENYGDNGELVTGLLSADALHYKVFDTGVCSLVLDRQVGTSIEVLHDFADAPQHDDVGGALWHNGSLYFFSSGYYD